MVSGRLVVAFGLLATASGCVTRPVSVVSASCGAETGITAQVAAACDGRAACEIGAMDLAKSQGLSCTQGLVVAWRCPGDEALHSATLNDDGIRAGQRLALECSTRAPARIEILDVVGATTVPSEDIVRVVIDACAGHTSCEPRLGADPASADRVKSDGLKIQWRCEGTMELQTTPVDHDGRARLSC